ncbi:metallophosphoesterase family protein [Chloroflexota bacterium]
MLIGLLSDTHIPDHASKLPAQIKDVFRDVDMIMHAGDVYVVKVLDELEQLAPVYTARGDDEHPEIFKDRRVNQKHVLNIEGITIWLMHIRPWSGFSGNRNPYSIVPQPVKLPDVVVYGHTHRAKIEHDDGILLVNPGSATFPNYKNEPGTVGLLTVNSGKAEAQIVQLK